jgi:F-box interacting protein
VSLLFRLNYVRNNSVYLSGTINWLALTPHNGSGLEQYVILSLDLSTEKYTQLLLSWDFDRESSFRPAIAVLMDHLCFCHDFDEFHFVIWQMEDFGVQESWIQLFKIGYNHFSSF